MIDIKNDSQLEPTGGFWYNLNCVLFLNQIFHDNFHLIFFISNWVLVIAENVKKDFHELFLKVDLKMFI